MCLKPLKLNYKRKAHITWTGAFLEHPAQMSRETTPLSPTEDLLNKAILPRPGVIADLCNTKQQQQQKPQRDSRNRKTKKQAPNERLREFSRRIAK